MNDKSTIAMELFKKGYNCSQAVIGAFADDLNMDPDTLIKLSSSFGGGMGRMREVCGAVSAMFMIAGLKQGYVIPCPNDEKAAHYKFIQTLANEFKNENGSIICRELLKGNETSSPTPSDRTKEYYKKRPCTELVGCAAKIIGQHIK